jgi:predicted TIM-barrel fold metal-dependent hydrolase
MMAHAYPNVWVDFAQIMPWQAINMASVVEDVLGIAPHTKVTYGGGAHEHPELNWLCAKVAKLTTEELMQRAVERSYMTKKQAEETAAQLLYKNAQRLYKLNLA